MYKTLGSVYNCLQGGFMILNAIQIKSVAFGYVDSKIKDGLLYLQKCTDAQISAWYNIRQDLGERAEATTGIKLDFYTDGDAIEFSFIKGRKVEVYIDNLFRGQYLMDEYRNSGKRVCIPLKDTIGNSYDKVRVTVYFPAHDEQGVIDYFEVKNATYIERYNHSIKVLFIGDSITQGWATMTDTFSYAQRLTRYLDAESVINGVGGAMFAESTFDSIDFDPDVVILSYGTNDVGFWQNGDEMLSHIKTYMSLVKKQYQGKKIFAISPIWRTDFAATFKTGTFAEGRARVKAVAEELGFVHVDGLKLVPPSAEYFFDHVHPNEQGFSFYAENLFIELKKHL